MTHLSSKEWILMKVLWQHPSLTITNIVSLLKGDTGWNKHTVITMLNRLEKKNAISFDDTGKAKHFYATINQSDATVEETKSFLDKVYNGSISLLINTMVSNRSLSSKELDELCNILTNAEVDKNE